MPKFYFIDDHYGRAFRVWKEDRPGDAFAIIPYDQPVMEFVKELCRQYPSDFIFGDPEDEEEGG
jgi:hypothetical protein